MRQDCEMIQGIIIVLLILIQWISRLVIKYWYFVVAGIFIMCLLLRDEQTKDNSHEQSKEDNHSNTKSQESITLSEPHTSYSATLPLVDNPISTYPTTTNKPISVDITEDLVCKSSHVDGELQTEEQAIDYKRTSEEAGFKPTSVETNDNNDTDPGIVVADNTLIQSIPVYCSMQKQYGVGYIINANPKRQIITIRFSSGERNYGISYIGKTIFAVSGIDDTNKIKEMVNSISSIEPAVTQNINKIDSECQPSSRYNSNWEAKPIYSPSKPPVRFYYAGKVPCFSEEWISRRVSVERTKVRGKVLYETNGVLKLQRNGSSYQALVRGSSGFNYICSFRIDSDEKIEAWHCNCPAFAKYPKACKHLVAAFYAAGEKN